MKRKNIFVATVFFLLQGTLVLFATNDNGWSIKMENPKSFIENKGQFKLSNESSCENSSVKYAYANGSTMIYFTSTGVTYSFLKKWSNRKERSPKEMAEERVREQKEMQEGKSHAEMEAEERRMEFKTDIVNMFWEGANPNAELVAEEPTPDHHSYQIKRANSVHENIHNIKAFKKLIYKNLYPGIDVEYSFHQDNGIKYTLILHPGANPSLIKMNYSGAVQIDSDGNVHIKTKFGDIVDHAPISFYSDNSSSIVESHFVKKGNVVSFALAGYDNSKTLIIDPWVVTPTGLTNSNCVWECEKDGAGNVYIIGGDKPLKLKKFNSAGVLQWTYNTPFDTTNSDWLGTMATDLAGNTYVTNGSEARLLKVNNAGTMVYLANGGSLDEYWTIAFNCDQTKLIVGGTRLGFPPPANSWGMIFDINTATGAVLATKKVGWTRPYTAFGFGVNDINEVRSMTSSYNSRYYFLTLDSIGCIDQNFSSCPGSDNIFSINSTYNFGYKCENYRPMPWTGDGFAGNGGICSIRANGNFVYSQNGTTVHKRSLTTGAILATATITGGSTVASGAGISPTLYQPNNSGIDIDSCGNVYVGSGNAVIKFDANLNLLTSVATSFNVYDVAVSYGGNVIAAGSTGTSTSTGRTGYVQQMNMTSCNPMILICCNTNFCAVGPFCQADAPITLSPDQTGGTWSGPGVNPTTGVFSPSVAGPGTHTISYSLSCGSSSVEITVSPCASLSLCQETNGTITVSNGVAPYTWQVYSPASSTPITNSTECTSCGYTWSFGTCLNGFTPVTTCNTPAGWSTFATGPNSGTLPGTYPIQVLDNTGSVATISDATAYAAIPPCTACPTLTITPASQVNVNCFGQSTGSFTVSSSAGTGPYDYTLMNGAITIASFTNVAGSQSFTGLAAGTYTLNVLDDNGCPGSISITITQPSTALAVSITGSTPATCGSSNGDATALASGGTSPYDYVWTGTTGTLQTTNNITTANTLSGLIAGTYTVTITDNNNCIATTTVSISSTGGATVNIAAQTNVLCFNGNTGSATATATGGTSPYDYVWTGTSGTLQTTNNISGSDILNGLTAGTYTVNITDNSGCVGSTTVTITQPANSVAVSITGSTNTACGLNNGDATALASGGTSPYDYVWTGTAGTLQTTNNITTSNTISSLAAGTYTVTITDNNSCSTFTTVSINSTGGATVSVTQTDVLCFGDSTGNATAAASGGSSPYDYVWTGSSGTLQATNNIAGSDLLTGLGAGTYTVSVTDNAGCISSTSVTIAEPSTAAIVSISGTTPAACGTANGSATAVASGGTGPYDYVWTNTSGTLLTANNITGPNTLSSISAGTYTVTITDNNNCTSSTTVTVSNSGAAITNISSSVNVLCFGASTGSATASTSGGASPYDYVWTGTSGVVHTDNDITAPSSATGLAAGTYTVSVTDNGGCISTNTVIITQPAAPLSSSTGIITHTTCGLNNGSASVTANGGTAGYLYSWAPSGGSGSSASSLSSGTYTITISDANSCTTTSTVSVNSSSGISATVTTSTNITCFGGNNGSATASGSGGTSAYTYSWSGAGGASATATGLTAGVYTVTVTNGSCSNTASVTITQPSAINATVITTPTTCGTTTGTAIVNAAGGTGSLGYLWSTGDTTSSINNLSAGALSVVITDASGCTATASGAVGATGSIAVDAGISATIILGTSTTLNGSSATGASFNWSPPYSLSCSACPSPVATPATTTTYTLTVTQNGCTGSDTVTVFVDETCGELFIPTAFSPNEDANGNDALKVYGNCITNLNFAIFDRWGEKVFETSNPDEGWDGTYKGKKLDTAVFVYYLTATVDGIDVKQHGNITLVK